MFVPFGVYNISAQTKWFIKQCFRSVSTFFLILAIKNIMSWKLNEITPKRKLNEVLFKLYCTMFTK